MSHHDNDADVSSNEDVNSSITSGESGKLVVDESPPQNNTLKPTNIQNEQLSLDSEFEKDFPPPKFAGPVSSSPLSQKSKTAQTHAATKGTKGGKKKLKKVTKKDK